MTTTAFSSRVTNWPLFAGLDAVAVALLVVLFASADGVGPRIVLACVAAVLVVVTVTTTSVSVMVGPAGVVVRYGMLGVPRITVPMTDVVSAEAVSLTVAGTGGWGIHWSPWRGTRLTIRSGPALVLHRHHGARMTISCRAPQTAVAVIDAHARPQGSPSAAR